MLQLSSRCGSIKIGSVRPYCNNHLLSLQKYRSFTTTRCVIWCSEASVRNLFTSTRLCRTPYNNNNNLSSWSSFSSSSSSAGGGGGAAVVEANDKDSYWNNPDNKGIYRLATSDRIGDGTFFGYKLEDSTSTAPLGQRSAPRSVPTHHSAHWFPGPICPPHLLDQATNEILQSDLGSLYAFNSQRINEEDHIRIIQDKFETLLRGFSACMEGSYLHRLLLRSNDAPQQKKQLLIDLDPLRVASASTQFVPKSDEHLPRMLQHVTTMRQLLERLEREAEMYWKDKHSKVTSSSSSNTTTESIHQSEEKGIMAVQMKHEEEPTPLTNNVSSSLGAAPGPTTTMYDLVLDANAIYASCIPLEDDDAKITAMNTSRALFQTILARHDADGGPANVNPSTIPSPRSFNTLIQTAAMVQYTNSSSSSSSTVGGERVRDEAIDLAFVTFDRMYRNDAVNRTWTTYENLLQVVFKFIPTSRSKGNIAYALFLQACDEGVVSEAVWEKLVSFGGLGNGLDLDRYLQENSQKTWKQLPHKWRKFANTPNYGTKLRRSYNDGSFFYDG